MTEAPYCFACDIFDADADDDSEDSDDDDDVVWMCGLYCLQTAYVNQRNVSVRDCIVKRKK